MVRQVLVDRQQRRGDGGPGHSQVSSARSGSSVAARKRARAIPGAPWHQSPEVIRWARRRGGIVGGPQVGPVAYLRVEQRILVGERTAGSVKED